MPPTPSCCWCTRVIDVQLARTPVGSMTTDSDRVDSDKALAEAQLLADLLEHGLLISCGVLGVYGRGAVFEAVLEGFSKLVTHLTREDGASHVHFPPIINRAYMERAEYLESFPHLAGLVYSFQGDEAQHQELIDKVRQGQAYGHLPRMTELALTPAACHALYPTCSGRLPKGGRLIDLSSYCFRHEPSNDPARMQMFRMREHVRLGLPDEVQKWRELWLERGRRLLANLGLNVSEAPANDPFFGRGGRMLAANQRLQQLKFELVTPITSQTVPTAVMSFNYHQEHFSRLYAIQSHDGELAHSACLGFGLERIVIALFKTHGFEPLRWPVALQQRLNLCVAEGGATLAGVT
jgi:seryl-tRNA synthetase